MRMFRRLTSSVLILVMAGLSVSLSGCSLSCIRAAGGVDAERAPGCNAHQSAVAAAGADRCAFAAVGWHHPPQTDAAIVPSVGDGFQSHATSGGWTVLRPSASGQPPAGGAGFFLGQARAGPSSAAYHLQVLRI